MMLLMIVSCMMVVISGADSSLIDVGQCNVHAAALIAEYLNLSEVQKGLPVGSIAFRAISEDIELLESSAHNDAVSPDQVGGG